MKFSHSLLKQLVPGLADKSKTIELLSLYSFEAEDAKGDTIEISISPNRFSDAASHWGIAKELSAILGRKLKLQITNYKLQAKSSPRVNPKFSIQIQDKKLCRRYGAGYFENIKIASSPKWMREILADCGIRPINNVVDIMNYVMIEVGQPLHAFDYDKLANGGKFTKNNESGIRDNSRTIIVRRAKKGEKITGIDEKEYNLNENVLVIADKGGPIGIAGIKGGLNTAVDEKTKRIIVEAANFDGVNIYRSSRDLKLQTDAAVRFSHSISPELIPFALARVEELLNRYAGAKHGETLDVNYDKPAKKIIPFDIERFNKFIGTNIVEKEAKKHLERLGFSMIDDSRRKLKNLKLGTSKLLLVPPPLRDDVETFEDVAEEVARLVGYNNIPSRPPHIHIYPSGSEDQIILKDKIRRLLASWGLNEVYTYSFSGEKDLSEGMEKEKVELENPISAQYEFLRPSLIPNLAKALEQNLKFKNYVKIFEIGKIFSKSKGSGVNEKLVLGIGFASKEKETFFDIKGVINELLKRVGLADFTGDYLREKMLVRIESEGNTLGYIGKVKRAEAGYEAVAEIDLDNLLKLVSGEHEYSPLSKYPSVMRDITLVPADDARVGDIMREIQDAEKKYIEDVDLIDEYQSKEGGAAHFTFRIIFEARDRTLTDEEVNGKMKKIEKNLKNKFKIQIK